MRMSPQDFWSLTPAEWGWLTAAAAPAAGAMRRSDAEKLAAQYPDELENTKRGAPCEL